MVIIDINSAQGKSYLNNLFALGQNNKSSNNTIAKAIIFHN